MKMNMKNNKTMLALLVVAALAMVSVAGVALSNEDSDAASTGTTYLNTGNITLENMTVTSDYYVYNILDGLSTAPAGTTVTITISTTATLTGHIYFGTAKTVSGKVVEDSVKNDIYLNGVSNVTIVVYIDTVTAGTPETATATTTVYGSTTGSITLNTGSLTIGYPVDDQSFTGTVVANGVTLDSDYIAGTTVSLKTSGSRTTTYLTGGVVGIWTDMYDVDSSNVVTLTGDSIPTLSVTGTFVITDSVSTFYVEYAALVITTGSTATLYSASGISSELQNDGVVTVDGTLIVENLATPVDSIDNNGILYVSGVIEYTTVLAITTTPIDDGYLCASYYYEKSSSTTNIHYYTTFTNAIANSETVTVFGLNIVTEDITIENTVILGDNAVIIVGIPDIQVDVSDVLSTLLTSNELGLLDDAMSIFGLTAESFEPSYATITVAADATLDTSAGDLYVINGKLSVNIDAATNCNFDEVTASVEMKEGTSTIYTNLETALDLATDGDTVVLSWYGYIFSDSTIAEGVTVDGATNGYDIFVYCGTTLNINGTIEGDSLYVLPNVDATVVRGGETTTISLDAAVVNVNAGASVSLDYNLYLFGTMNVASGFDNVSTGATDVFTVAGDIYVLEVSEEDSIDVEVELYYDSITSTQYYYNIVADYTVDINGSQLNVAGKLNLGSTTLIGFASNDTFTVNVTGTLKSAAFNSDVYSVVTVSGSYISTGPENISKLVVSGTGSVTETSSGELSVDYITSGTAATSFSGVQNNVTIQTTGTVGYALIYGITGTDAISFNASSTEFYMSNAGTSVLYAVEYSSTSEAGVYLSPSVTGYDFISWYTEDGYYVSKSDIIYNSIGYYDELYTYFELTEYTVTLDYVQNGTWVINGISYGTGGNVTLSYSSSGYTVELKAANGYHLNNVSILLDNKVLPNGYTSTLADGQVFTISGSIDVDSESESTDIIEILLIIITIVVVIMAIVIALRLMRS
jgi:hypothetical protein